MNKMERTYEDKLIKKIPIPLFHEMPCKVLQKEKRKTFKYIFNRIRLKNCASATISRPHSTYYVAYLGNVVTGWAKGDGCIEKPLSTLWRNYTQSSRPDVNMQLTVSGGGLKVVTKNHGLTEYWAHRLTTCAAPHDFPRIFCWVYRHEGRRLKHELRCHAVLCSSSDIAKKIEKELKDSLSRALNEFKKDKLSRQNARLSLVNSINEYPSLPRRKILLSTGSHNYRPPLECSRSAPKLSSIEESYAEEQEDIFKSSHQLYAKILKSFEKCDLSLERKNKYNNMLGKALKKNDTDTFKLTLGNRINNCILNKGYKQIDEETTVPSSDDNVRCSTISNKIENMASDNRTSFETDINSDLPCDSAKEDCKNNDNESDQKLELDFKIGGVVLPSIKNYEKIPSKDHNFINPYITKGLMEQEQVSLIPVGESQSDFSSLKVYKKRGFGENGKDIHIPCTIFQSCDNLTNENLDQTHSSFSSDHRYEEEISNKINSTLVV